MKNITVSLDNELYRKARFEAARADTSVTALVREFFLLLTGSGRETIEESAATQSILDAIETLRRRHPDFDPATPDRN